MYFATESTSNSFFQEFPKILQFTSVGHYSRCPEMFNSPLFVCIVRPLESVRPAPYQTNTFGICPFSRILHLPNLVSTNYTVLALQRKLKKITFIPCLKFVSSSALHKLIHFSMPLISERWKRSIQEKSSFFLGFFILITMRANWHISVLSFSSTILSGQLWGWYITYPTSWRVSSFSQIYPTSQFWILLSTSFLNLVL